MLFALVLASFLSFQSVSHSDAAKIPARNSSNWKDAENVYEFNVKTIGGKLISLKKYEHLVLIIVNVASKCGYTDEHYKELVELDEKYHKKGLRILAFPCNQFYRQEPGNATAIRKFAAKYNAKFDLFKKIKVNGENADPLWKYLKSKIGGLLNDDIKWNFTKFIIDRSGVPVERHGADISPLELERPLDRYF